MWIFVGTEDLASCENGFGLDQRPKLEKVWDAEIGCRGFFRVLGLG